MVSAGVGLVFMVCRLVLSALAKMSYYLQILPIRVFIVCFEGAQSLDFAGPSEVFALASKHSQQFKSPLLLSTGGGVRCTSSIAVYTHDLTKVRPGANDIVLVAGGPESAIRGAVSDRVLAKWLKAISGRVRVFGSVCSGAFILAALGLLDGKRAATHWRACDRLRTLFPNVNVDREAIFVVDGRMWTSAGVTAGIDMALAMVETFADASLAQAIASELVLYARRPGHQSQFSEAMIAQSVGDPALSRAIAWTRANITRATIAVLAKHVGQSVRTFHRRCNEVFGLTPRNLIERIRVEHARMLLEHRKPSPKQLATQSGFHNVAQLERAFRRVLGISPTQYRHLHGLDGETRGAL
jgi:transcriptional regulator GlxA family with amidase domain